MLSGSERGAWCGVVDRNKDGPEVGGCHDFIHCR